MKKNLAAATILIALLSGCADAPSPSPTSASIDSPPTSTMADIATAAPTDTALPEPTATRESPILYQSDFSDVNSGWENYREFDGILAVEEGEYRLQVHQAQQTFWVVAGHNHQNLILEADARYSEGPEANRFGVLCRYRTDPLSFYAFMISNEGHAEIAIWENGALSTLQNVGFEALQDAHFMRAECLGLTLALHVNGELLISIEDERLTTGDVGMLISNGDEGETSVFIDNFTVRQP